MTTPESVKYTKDHEWARKEEDGSVTVGITHYAQDSLGDVVYVELPEVGDEYEAGDEAAEVESTKATSPVMAPVSGKVLAVNEALNDTPELINQDPYGDGWLLRIQMKSPSQYGKLMNAQAYRTHVESEASGAS
jgi:glycine cleavage system H protein